MYVYDEVNYLWWIVYTLDWYGSAEGGREKSVEEEDKQEKQKGEEEKEHTSALSLQSWKPSPTHARSGVGGGGLSMQQLPGWNGT